MIIDSHAHYSHKLYTGDFNCLDYKDGSFCCSRFTLKELVETMKNRGIGLCIEPSTTFDRIQDQLTLVEQFAPYFRLAMGIHPKHCDKIAWEQREKLRTLVMKHDIVAVGETGLEYSDKPEQVDPDCQKLWFRYQIGLAHERQLPLILHSRDAHHDVLAILRENREILHGGVAHCFGADYETAMAYVDLGFTLGIGGKLLSDDGEAQVLQDAVTRVPLDAILVETDAPYIKPDTVNLFSSRKQKQKTRNTSLILPAVIDRIAQLRGVNPAVVEKAIHRNTVRTFRL